MTTTHVHSIYRYPLKGFAGERLPFADLRPGRGFPFDRAFAIPNGQATIRPDGVWTPCQAFVRLTKNPDLLGYLVNFDEPQRALTLIAPGGTSINFPVDGTVRDHQASKLLAKWFGLPSPSEDGVPITRRAKPSQQGFWDHEDGHISIINLDTLNMLEGHAGQLIDPLRFRANIYISGLEAFTEYSLLGRRLQIGGAIVEIIRPIDRCRATSIDPLSSSRSLNMPTLLAKAQGHIFCGLYARVLQRGRVADGASIVDLDLSAGSKQSAAKVATAPPVADWPRQARLIDRNQEGADVVSFWLEDPLAELRKPPKAGQHIRLHLVAADGSPLWRAYTVSGHKEGHLRISIKRDGLVSGLVHDELTPGSYIQITGPFDAASVDLEGDDTPLAFLSAGIGITPTTAYLQELGEARRERPVFVLHVARNLDELVLWDEVRRAVGLLPNAQTSLYLTQSDDGQCRSLNALPGRPNFDAAVLQHFREHGRFMVCGPPSFVKDVYSFLMVQNVHPSRIHIETFASPHSKTGSSVATPDQRPEGPFAVHFQNGGIRGIWAATDGSILDLAEQLGLSPPANCRSGACGTCKARIVSGSVVHDPEPVLPITSDFALICCAVPMSDIVLE
jgi:ferredoxin-NADP reductase/uncharacterized protein YcbX/ferredoxin